MTKVLELNSKPLNLPSPHIEFISDREALLLDDYSIDTSIGRITIKRGFVSDGASIPFMFWSLLQEQPFSGKLLPSALVHDILYRTHYVSYHQVNLIFNELAKMNNVPRIKCFLMLQTLNAFGWIAYRNENDIPDGLKYFEIIPKVLTT